MDFKQFYKTINFDIDNEIRTVYQATQGDTKSRGLVVDVIVGGVKTPVTTETMNFFALKPDGTRVITAGIKDGDKFRIDFTNQTFAVPGTLLCALVLYGTNGEKIADKKFKMTVDTSLEDGAIISKDERSVLDRAFDLASDILPRLEALDVPLLENLEQRFDNLIATPVPTGEIIAEEIIDARQGELSLGANITEVKSQLAETKVDIFHSKSTDHNTKKPLMSFVDDDGRSEFYTKWKPIIENKNIPVTSALVTSKIGVDSRYLTINQIKELKELGVEFVSHAHDHGYLGNFTETELRAEFELSQSFLKQHGLTHDVLVYPYGSQSILLRQIAREYFACGVDTLEGINVPPISTYRLNRKGWFEGGRVTLEDHKAVIDEVVANGGWLIWKTHSQYPEFVGEQLTAINEIIDYARGLGIEIVNIKEGLKRKGNLVDIGDIEQAVWHNVAVIDSEGQSYGSNIGSHKFMGYTQSGVDINGSITQFTKVCRTVIQMGANDVSGLGLPNNNAGFLEVFRGASNHYGQQIYHEHMSSLKHARYWDNTTETWSKWSLLNAHSYLGTNSVTADTSPNDSILKGNFTSANINTSGASGFPENKGGLLLTYASFTGSGFPRQEYTVYGTDKKYTRYWNGSAWTDWVQLGGGSGSTLLRPTDVHRGYMYYDTVLKKPIWWSGTNWVDATGTTV